MSEQEIEEMAILKITPLISLGGKDRNFNDRIFYMQGAKDCNLKWQEKLRWVPVLYEKHGYFSDSTISLMKKSLPFILKYDNGFIELIENESEIVDSFGAIEFRSVFL